MATNGGASWFRRLFSRAKAPPLDAARMDLVVVASSFDDAESCTAALERGADMNGWVATDEAVLRHHLVLPSDMVADAAAVAGQDGYFQPAASATVPAASEVQGSSAVTDGVSVVLQRVQVVDALHCSQERSRMAGLAQRRGGMVLGWDALQPASSHSRPAD